MQKKIKILIVDDDPDDLLVIEEYLKEGISYPGVSIDKVTSSKDAYEKIKYAKYDSYIIDYQIDTLNGIDILQSLSSYGKKIPVIILTGLGDENLAAKALKSGAVDYLSKRELSPEKLSNSVLNSIKSTSELRSNEFKMFYEHSIDRLGVLGK